MRDKLYSSLGVLNEDHYGFMEADYSLSVEDLALWVFRVCIELDKEYSCLVAACPGRPSKPRGFGADSSNFTWKVSCFMDVVTEKSNLEVQ